MNKHIGGDRKARNKNEIGEIILGKQIPKKSQGIMPVLLHNLKKGNRCPICKKYKFNDVMLAHIATHKKFQCNKCNAYLNRFDYSKHMDSHELANLFNKIKL